MKRSARGSTSALLAALALALFPASAFAAPHPRLTVLIVAEQFRPDYLERFRAALSAGGFHRLLKGGAVFRNCRYDYLATFPASGAAVLATGSYPDRNGILAERWYDRRSANVVGAVRDPHVLLVGSDTQRQGASPRNLVGTTLADQLRLATGDRSRTVSISLRDSTAVLLAGRKPAGCYWLDDAGRFVTSSYYADALPSWVTAFEKTHPPERHRGQAWKALDAKEDTPPLQVIGRQDSLDPAAYQAAYRASPFALDDEFDFAREAVTGEHLGERGSPDLLIVSVSSLYLLGLDSGADSPLMRDLVLRFDRKLEEFLAWLDSHFGAGNVWTAFTATQGLPESSDTLAAEGIPSGRVSGDEIVAAVNARLAAVYGRPTDRRAGYVEKYVYPWLYLRRDAVDRLADAAHLAGEAALTVPGVAAYYVPGGASSLQTPLSVTPFAHCYFPERSGDLLLAYQPYYTERYAGGRGVEPGSSYSYDARVPLILYGPAFRAQTFERPVNPADLAVTLAAALDLPPPSSATGRVLFEALKER